MLHHAVSLLLGLVLSMLCISTVYAQDEDQKMPPPQQIFLPFVQVPPPPDDRIGEWRHYRVNPVTLQIEPDYSVVEPAGVCLPPALWEGGEVKWIMSSAPKTYGFSVKPETSNSLIWGQLPSQLIDGIYKYSWGNNRALKVNNGCRVEMKPDSSYSTCCYPGVSVYWVNTTTGAEASWPDVPLQP
jgi:hypothetical protein